MGTKMSPETAMRQAGMTAMEYFDACYKYINATHPDVSEEVKMHCASRMALAASIDFATSVFASRVQGDYAFKVSVNDSRIEFD